MTTGTRIALVTPGAMAGAVNDPALVRTAEEAITIVMYENAVDADTAAEVIRDRAAANNLTIAELTHAIVTVVATSNIARTT